MSATATTGVSMDPSAFLKLFITQMKYQDPTAPMDPSQMMSNLTQLTTVQSLNNLQTSFQQSLANGMIGSQVTYTLNGKPQTGLVQATQIQNGQVGVLVAGQSGSAGTPLFVTLDSVTQIAPPPAANQSVSGS